MEADEDGLTLSLSKLVRDRLFRASMRLGWLDHLDEHGNRRTDWLYDRAFAARFHPYETFDAVTREPAKASLITHSRLPPLKRHLFDFEAVRRRRNMVKTRKSADPEDSVLRDTRGAPGVGWHLIRV